MDMNERDLEKLSKAELINLVEKLQNKAGNQLRNQGIWLRSYRIKLGNQRLQ